MVLCACGYVWMYTTVYVYMQGDTRVVVSKGICLVVCAREYVSGTCVQHMPGPCCRCAGVSASACML